MRGGKAAQLGFPSSSPGFSGALPTVEQDSMTRTALNGWPPPDELASRPDALIPRPCALFSSPAAFIPLL